MYSLYQNLFSSFNQVICLTGELWEFFIDSGYKSFIRYYLWKCSFQSITYLFTFKLCPWSKILNFYPICVINFCYGSYVSLWWHALSTLSPNPESHVKIFFKAWLLVLCLHLSQIHFGSYFSVVRGKSLNSALCIYVWNCLNIIHLKDYNFPQLNFCCPFDKNFVNWW